MSYRRQELSTLCEPMGSSPFLGEVHVAHPVMFCEVSFVVFLRPVSCPVLSISLDCPFLIASSVLSNVYLLEIDGVL